MDSARMELVCALLGGMGDIVRWRGVQMLAPTMGSVDSTRMELGSVVAIMVGMERTAAYFSNRAAMTDEIMTKVKF